MTDADELPTPHYRIDGYEPANERIEDDFYLVTSSDTMFVPLADHHSTDGRHSYLVCYDASAIWDLPGTAEYVAFHITRDIAQRTFTFDYARHPVAALAQNWLIHEGCPPEAIELTDPNGPRPADALTTRLEDQLRANRDGRYTVIDHYTDNPASLDVGVEVRAFVHDSHPDSASAPYRLFLEETAKDLRSYTLREGAFATAEAADDWAMERSSPLPLAPAPPSDAERRAQAARARSTLKAPGLAAPPAPVAPPRSPAPTARHPRRGTP
ncbi:hypothetical protein ACQB60_07305 [Actinomycetota bacterium Odt1-20B]